MTKFHNKLILMRNKAKLSLTIGCILFILSFLWMAICCNYTISEGIGILGFLGLLLCSFGLICYAVHMFVEAGEQEWRGRFK